ncbi:Acetyltransferase (GNAT) family protein [Pseudomonas sp. NFACC02]|uniref:GNAT family N-acetyltransferase n=1 Tax=Pseudomonas sp. NFACC02 TaxID=1566250 RepID=UPI0008B43CF4|nr:GNAT family N-acetyltransferase [Pseudomonas sp. NFACC02]SEQ01561.1 Acetyltransferase (GNAT) family protein [Pseudomonas sp. NFACC02]
MAYDTSVVTRFDDETKALSGDYWLEPMRDGSPMLIRELAARDRERDFVFFKELGSGTPHFRFLASFSECEGTHDQLMDVSLPNRMAYIALAYEGTELKEIGMARYGAFEGDAHCEFAVAVSEKWRRKGVASALMQHLMDTAKRQGFQKISSMDASNNRPMDGLAISLGFDCRNNDEHGLKIFHEYELR